MNKLVCSISEMADLLCIGRSKAYQLANMEGFPAVHIGKRIVVPIAALEDWLREHGGEVGRAQ